MWDVMLCWCECLWRKVKEKCFLGRLHLRYLRLHHGVIKHVHGLPPKNVHCF